MNTLGSKHYMCKTFNTLPRSFKLHWFFSLQDYDVVLTDEMYTVYFNKDKVSVNWDESKSFFKKDIADIILKNEYHAEIILKNKIRYTLAITDEAEFIDEVGMYTDPINFLVHEYTLLDERQFIRLGDGIFKYDQETGEIECDGINLERLKIIYKTGELTDGKYCYIPEKFELQKLPMPDGIEDEEEIEKGQESEPKVCGIDDIRDVLNKVRRLSEKIGPELEDIFRSCSAELEMDKQTLVQLVFVLFCFEWNLKVDKEDDVYNITNKNLPGWYSVQLAEDELQSFHLDKMDRIRMLAAISNPELFKVFQSKK